MEAKKGNRLLDALVERYIFGRKIVEMDWPCVWLGDGCEIVPSRSVIKSDTEPSGWAGEYANSTERLEYHPVYLAEYGGAVWPPQPAEQYLELIDESELEAYHELYFCDVTVCGYFTSNYQECFQVVDKLRSEGYRFSMLELWPNSISEVFISGEPEFKIEFYTVGGREKYCATAKTALEAICLAAIETRGIHILLDKLVKSDCVVEDKESKPKIEEKQNASGELKH